MRPDVFFPFCDTPDSKRATRKKNILTFFSKFISHWYLLLLVVFIHKRTQSQVGTIVLLEFNSNIPYKIATFFSLPNHSRSTTT